MISKVVHAYNFEDLSNYANYLIKYAKTVLEMLRIRFYIKNCTRNIHFELILMLKKLKNNQILIFIIHFHAVSHG